MVILASALMLPLPAKATVSSWMLVFALMLPVFCNRPSAVMLISPALAPMLPALRTPRPASVPTMLILPAYMPPKAATSIAKLGVGLALPSGRVAFGVIGVVLVTSPLLATLTWLVPVVTLSAFAQIPAFTSIARAITSVKLACEVSSPLPVILILPPPTR